MSALDARRRRHLRPGRRVPPRLHVPPRPHGPAAGRPRQGGRPRLRRHPPRPRHPARDVHRRRGRHRRLVQDPRARAGLRRRGRAQDDAGRLEPGLHELGRPRRTWPAAGEHPDTAAFRRRARVRLPPPRAPAASTTTTTARPTASSRTTRTRRCRGTRRKATRPPAGGVDDLHGVGHRERHLTGRQRPRPAVLLQLELHHGRTAGHGLRVDDPGHDGHPEHAPAARRSPAGAPGGPAGRGVAGHSVVRRPPGPAHRAVRPHLPRPRLRRGHRARRVLRRPGHRITLNVRVANARGSASTGTLRLR